MTNYMPTEPLMVHCSKCDREWSLGWLPMPIDSMAAICKATRCACGAPKKSVQMGPTPKLTTEGDPVAWLSNGDTGTSSKTIWSVMMNKPIRDAGVPRDPDDFGRCYRLLKVMPSWTARLPEVAAKYPAWTPLVPAWGELTAMYERVIAGAKGWDLKASSQMYQRMVELREEPQPVSGPAIRRMSNES